MSELNGCSSSTTNKSEQLNKERAVPESIYRKHVLRARSTRNHFTFSRDWVFIMSRDKALFIQDLINRAAGKKTRCKQKKCTDEVTRDFFLCTSRFLSSTALHWSEDTQVRYLKWLRERGFVITASMGVPAKRWIHIDIEALENAIDKRAEPEVFDEKQLPQVAVTSHRKNAATGQRKNAVASSSKNAATPINNNKENKDKINKNKGALQPRRNQPDFCYIWVDRLRTILRSTTPSRPISISGLENPAKEFKDLWKDLGGDENASSQINVLLDRYTKHIDKVDKPKIASVPDLRRTFTWLWSVLEELEEKSATSPRIKQVTETDKSGNTKQYYTVDAQEDNDVIN